MKMNDNNSKSRLNRRTYILFLVLMIVIGLAACKGAGAITPISQSQQEQGNPTITVTNTILPPTETPTPTSTLVPTLVPSPTAIPEQPLPEIIASVSEAVYFRPVEETMAYDKQKTGPHHIVLITEQGKPHDGNDDIPGEWLPRNRGEVELIAIITPEEVVIRNITKYFNGRHENRSCVRRDIRVKLVEANSGELIDKILFQGSYPKLCEFWDMNRWVYGEPPSFDEVVLWLQGYVSP